MCGKYRFSRIPIDFDLKRCHIKILWVIIVKVAHQIANFRFVRNIMHLMSAFEGNSFVTKSRETLRFEERKETILKFKNLSKGFPQHFLLPAVYFRLFQKIYKLACSKFCLLVSPGNILHLPKATRPQISQSWIGFPPSYITILFIAVRPVVYLRVSAPPKSHINTG